MPPSVGFNLIAFQAKVMREIERIQKLSDKGEQFFKEPPFPKSKEDVSGCRRIALSLTLRWMRFLSVRAYRGLKRKREQLTARAERLAEQKEVKQHLCPSLQNVAGDPFDIAKVITPNLVGLANTNSIHLPLEADLFAMLALVIAKRGIGDYCSGWNNIR